MHVKISLRVQFTMKYLSSYDKLLSVSLVHVKKLHYTLLSCSRSFCHRHRTNCAIFCMTNVCLVMRRLSLSEKVQKFNMKRSKSDSTIDES